MLRLSIKPVILAVAVFGGPIAAQTRPAPPAGAEAVPQGRIVMFGASWCAPCIAELRSIAAIAAAARPDRVVIAWTDGGIRKFRQRLPANVEIAPFPAAQELSRQFAAEGGGLPYTVMLDERLRKCASLNAQLTPAGIAALRRACSERRSGAH